METQNSHLQHRTQGNDDGTFALGSLVIYGLHGKCSVRAIEKRQLGGEQIPFYRLEIQKSNLSRSTRQEAEIWVPVNSARERGMRAPITGDQANQIFEILSNREYYFSVNESWGIVQKKLEAALRTEGCSGLAKAVSYLFVLKRKQVVPAPEVTKLDETFHKLLTRELSDALGETITAVDAKIAKALRRKLRPDS